MIPHDRAVVGIDVGGKKKGFHAILLRSGVLETTISSANPADIVEWCRQGNADVIGVDAPSGWSQSGSSRAAERELKLAGKQIHCFATPTRTRAPDHKKGFYDWVFNGEDLYCQLKKLRYQLFDGRPVKGPVCFETFPHAVVCALAGAVVPAKPKKFTRLKVLSEENYNVSLLSNLDFIDAALCAVTAEHFRRGHTIHFGQRDEGFIVLPALDVSPA